MAEKTVYSNCAVCGGDGSIGRLYINPDTHEETWVTDACTKCGGNGEVQSGNLDDDLVTHLNDITSTLADIVEKLNDIKTVVDAL